MEISTNNFSEKEDNDISKNENIYRMLLSIHKEGNSLEDIISYVESCGLNSEDMLNCWKFYDR